MSIAQDIRIFIQHQAEILPQKSQSKPSYTGSQRIHYGVPLPIMRGYLKMWLQKNNLNEADWLSALHDLYSGTSLEEKVFAGMLLGRFAKFRRSLPLTVLDDWLEQLEGWNEIDNTCQSVFTPVDLLADWVAWENFLRTLATDKNINKRRSALVLLVLPVRESRDKRFLFLALEIVDRLKHEKDKLISKAISWLLREAIKQHSDAVREYVETDKANLPTFVLREVQRKLDTGKK